MKCEKCGKEYSKEEGVIITTSDGYDWGAEIVHSSDCCEVKKNEIKK